MIDWKVCDDKLMWWFDVKFWKSLNVLLRVLRILMEVSDGWFCEENWSGYGLWNLENGLFVNSDIFYVIILRF